MKPRDYVDLVVPRPRPVLRAIPGTTAPGLAPAPVPVAEGQGRPDRPCLACGSRLWARIEGCPAWWCPGCVPLQGARRRVVAVVEVV